MPTTVVIGAGVIGLCCAYDLSKRGRQVIVLDMGKAGDACSWGNAGWVAPSFSTPLPEPGLVWTSIKWMLKRDSPLFIDPLVAPWMAGWLLDFWRHCNPEHLRRGVEALSHLNQRTLALFDELESDGVPFEMYRDGILYVFQTEDGLSHAAGSGRIIEKEGFPPPRKVSADELRALEPALSPATIGGYVFPHERHVRPDTLTAGLVARLRERGAQVREHVEVREAQLRGSRIRAVTTSAGEIEADEFLLAGGAWSGRLAARFGFHIPIQAGKGYSVTIDQPAIKLSKALYLAEAKFGVTPFNGGLRFAGTMEMSGLNSRMVRARLAAIRRNAERYVPGSLRGGTQVEWTGMRPLTPDGLPVIGRAPSADNLYVATGHGMLGVTLGPATGRVMAELICDGRTVTELEAFDPRRF